MYKSLLGTALFLLSLLAVAQTSQVEWSYEGDTGPSNWGSLSEDFVTCDTGLQQSPIDLPENTSLENNIDLTSWYKKTELVIKNNGHTVEVEYETPSFLFINDEPYQLLQFHFHSMSEHTRNGRQFPLEMHLVHRSREGELAVVGVLFEIGESNSAFNAILNNAPLLEETVHIENKSINATSLLPEDFNLKESSHYNGSLTTPGCTEGVKWFVLDDVSEISDEQFLKFQEFYNNNYRPTQPLNEREVSSGGND